MKRHLFVDGSHLAHRCRFSQVGQLATRDGRMTGVLHGFCKGLYYVIRQLGLRDRDVTVVWDGGRCASRKALFPDYKAGRIKPDESESDRFQRESCYTQMDLLHTKMLPALGIRSCRADGMEADDLIALGAHHVDGIATIFSGDQDFHQLASEKILIYDSKHDLRTASELAESWGVDCQHILRVRAIAGDKSDNIPGVPQVGPKRAVLVLQTALGILADEKKRKQGEKWLNHCDGYHSTIVRNTMLMRLPSRWQDSFVSASQWKTFSDQLATVVQPKPIEFVKICLEFELNELMEALR